MRILSPLFPQALNRHIDPKTRSHVGKRPWPCRLILWLVDPTAMVFSHVLFATPFFLDTAGDELCQQMRVQVQGTLTSA